MKNNLLITIIVAIVVGAVGFYAGMQYQKSQREVFGNPQFGRQMQNGQLGQSGLSGAGRGFGARPVTGEIISVDDKSITVKMQDGSSKIVVLSDKTSINKASEGTISDLKSGETISAFGTENSDGSITAQNIQLNPAFQMQDRVMMSPGPRNR